MTSPLLHAQILVLSPSTGRCSAPRATLPIMYKSVQSQVGTFKGSPEDLSRFLCSSEATAATGIHAAFFGDFFCLLVHSEIRIVVVRGEEVPEDHFLHGRRYVQDNRSGVIVRSGPVPLPPGERKDPKKQSSPACICPPQLPYSSFAGVFIARLWISGVQPVGSPYHAKLQVPLS